MRPLHLLLLGAHVLVLTVVRRDLLSGDLQPAAPPFSWDTVMVSVPEGRADAAEEQSHARLVAIDDDVSKLMGAIQQNARDLDAITALARLYMRHGLWEHAPGPLARAVELEPGRDDLRHQLELALELSDLGQDTDVTALAAEFAELAAMWGEHGC